MDNGFFGMAFDFDHDGHLNGFERAVDFSMFMGVMEECRQDSLRAAGLDPMDLDMKDTFERREALKKAGLAPDNFDF